MFRKFAVRLFRLLLFVSLLVISFSTTVYSRDSGQALSIASTETPIPEISPQASLALDYVSQEYSIPHTDLQVANEEQVNYPLIGRTFVSLTIWTIPPVEHREVALLVDLADNRIEPDIHAINSLETEAYKAKYGKLHPDLYERLQHAADEDDISIAVWLLPAADKRSQEELYNILAEKYPEVAEAIKLRGVPWGVEDETLSQQILNEYFQMLAEDVNKSVQPFIEKLKQLGVNESTTFDGMPSVALHISKHLILKMKNYDEIDVIYLIEDEPTQPSVTEVNSIFLPLVSR